jgi:hypothetical protein
MPLSELIELSNKLSFVYDDGAIGYQQAGLVDFVSEVKIKANEKFAVVINGRVVSPMTKVSDRQTEIIGGVGVLFSF